VKARLLAFVAALLVVALAPASAQQPKRRVPAPKRCTLELERAVGREAAQIVPFEGNENYYFGGDVRFRCQGQNVRIGADSVESMNGDVVRFITRAYYRDADVAVRADTLTYFKQGERLEARGSVHVITTGDSTTLDGPYLDYLRAVKGIRDSAESVAMQRPTLKVRPKRAATDTTADKGPYTIVADLLRGFGSSRLSGRGSVTINRSDLAGQGDSLLYTTGTAGRTILTGAPASWRRTGPDSFRVTGKDIRLGLTNEVLDDLRAYGDGDVHQDSTRVSGDSVALRFKDGKLEQTDAWGRTTQARATRAGYDITGDSVVVKTLRRNSRVDLRARARLHPEPGRHDDRVAGPRQHRRQHRDAQARTGHAVGQPDRGTVCPGGFRRHHADSPGARRGDRHRAFTDDPASREERQDHPDDQLLAGRHHPGDHEAVSRQWLRRGPDERSCRRSPA
jgi:hypothetical protein